MNSKHGNAVKKCDICRINPVKVAVAGRNGLDLCWHCYKREIVGCECFDIADEREVPEHGND